ncbi:PAS domain S-box-containing protein [Mycolicibacterium neoaurum]|mgnify:CR=1 FL=1|uniref:helix-turn-helix domain-containing protein n=1 Tax=Mycolicibacterium neoaurum TaxID=1795 RepID=UPI0008870B48|nr:helix-turn-helix domain-containing protein [Mycolicibacterium neoaurum]QVI27403.1 helix-turn-helix domain-containing protein [Mycolicibacterium neoaurum]SDC91105.1 PAS domain S-box-containing protein [Mycolicibacterium neoaurum]
MNETALDAGTLSAVIDVAPTPLWVIGPDGAVALANQAALTMLGYRSVDDVIGAPSHDTLHEWHPDGSRYPSHACPILDGCGSTSMTAHEWFITRAGQPIPVTWSAKPLGTSGARLLTFVDATERIAATTRTPDHHDLAPTRSELRARLLGYIRTHFHDPDFTAARLAAQFHLSLRSVQQLLAEDGRSPASEIRRHRLEHADSLIARGSSVGHACRASGFTDQGTFNRAFRRQYGVPPSERARRAG